MFRKQSVLLVLAATAFMFSSGVLANGAKKTTVAPCDGVRRGFYIGLQGGYGETDDGGGYSDAVDFAARYYRELDPGSDIQQENKHGYFGARAFVGYNINNYLGLEAGAAFSPTNRYYASGGDGSLDNTFKEEPVMGDFVGVLSVPLGRAWEIFGKGGIAFVNNRIENPNVDVNSHAWRPTYGLGINYILNPNIVFSLTGSQVLGKNKTSFDEETMAINNYDKVTPTCTLIAFGISYRFSNSAL